MVADLKNWVFEWIGGSSRSMGENDSQAKHLMGAVGTATRSSENSMGSAARMGKGDGKDSDVAEPGGAGANKNGVM